MFLRGLKLNIFIHLTILMALAMILTDIVLMWGFQNILFNDLISRADLVSTIVQNGLLQSGDPGINHLEDKNAIRAIFNEAGSSYGLILDKKRRPLFLTGALSENTGVGREIAIEAMDSGKKITRFTGAASGLFWKQKQYLVVATPLKEKEKIAGATVSAFDLEKVYAVLRNMQRMVWSFLLLNLVVLSIIGLFRISRTTVKPVQRLLERVEEYKEDDPVFFPGERKNNEFSRLSSALNRMLIRISEDRDRLRQTVLSLEKANAELKQARDDILRVEKLASVGRLSSGIAHEIGNPMGIILGYLELLKQNNLPEPDKKDFVLRAEKEVRRINSIIRRLLDFSRASNEKNEPFSVHYVIQELGSMVAPQPFMAGISLSFEPLARRDMVLGDANALRQVFLNLMINAADAISSENPSAVGNIRIITENINPFEFRQGNFPSIKITFKDNGPGISEKAAQNIFDPFFTTKAPGKGTGLGLSVSFMIVENMKGKIEVSGDTGAGAEVVVVLPLCRTE